jgi:hypothetical protein
MSYRVILTLTLIVGFAPFTFAEEVQASPSNIEKQDQGSEEIQVALEMHCLTIPEEIQVTLKMHLLTIPLEMHLTIPEEALGYFQKCKLNLPVMHSKTIFNKELLHSLLEAVQNDPLGYVSWIPTPKLPNGKETQASASTATVNTDSLETFQTTAIETFQATLSEKDQTVELRLTFRKDKDGKEWHPAMSVAIPLGSSLLIHAACSGQTTAFGSGRGDWVDNLFSLGATVEKDSGIYLLVTPRISSDSGVLILTPPRPLTVNRQGIGLA